MTSKQDKKTRFWNFLSSKDAMAKRQKTDFSGLSLTHEFHNYLVTGRRDYHYLDYFRDRYLPQAQPVIASLGCGNGHLERVLADKFLPGYAEIHGFDINPHLIEFARREAEKLGLKNLHYSVLDLDRLWLQPSYYDLVIFFHSLHHVERLEEALREVKKALKDDGLLLIVDFIGPTRFQWSDRQIFIAQGLLDAMPDKYKRDLSGEGLTLKTSISRPGADAIAQADPSEAVRSGEIMPIVEREFHIVEKKFMGGTLLSILLHNIAGNFNESDESDRTIILMMQKIEEITLRESILDPNYIFLVARKEFSGKKYEYYLKDQKLGFDNGTEILKTLYPGRVSVGWPSMTFAPEENEQLLSDLNDYGIQTEQVEISAQEYNDYISAAGYRKKYPDYYPEHFYEKTFEHFLALKLLDPQKNDNFIDIGAEHSPHADIFSRLTGCHGYMQDIMMKPGIHRNKIGCDASAIPVEDNFFHSILAACAIEHFEDDSDIRFMAEASRILKPGGRILILPLYLHEYPFYATDPISSVPGEVRFAEDIKIQCVKDWGNRQGRFYSPRTLHDRLIGPNRDTLMFRVIHANNFNRIHPSIYCRFVLLGEKKP